MGREVYEKNAFLVSIPGVASDQSSNRYKCVDIAGVITGGSSGTGAFGILQNAPESGQTALVAVGGIVKAIAGDTVTAGDLLTNEATTAHVISATSTNRVIGIAITAGAAGELLSMLVVPSNAINAAA